MRSYASALGRAAQRRCRTSWAPSKRSAASASALVVGEVDAEAAAIQVVDQLSEQLGKSSEATFALFFAKGYGPRSACVGPLLKERFSSALVMGCNSEGGVIGAGREVQNETFALTALAVSSSSLDAYPFHSPVLSQLPGLGRGGSWEAAAQAVPSALAMCTLPMAAPGDPQAWVRLLDIALTSRSASAPDPRPPVVVGGLAVGGHAFIDGEVHAAGGGFGAVLSGSGVRMDPVVCQGGEPFGPFLQITGVARDHVISQLDGQNPREVLQPLLNGPDVPGQGLSMAGVFVDPTPESSLSTGSSAALLGAALGGRPSCLVRPMHTFTEEGHLVLSPLCETLPYAEGMQLQLHCFSPTHALSELRSRAETDLALHGGKPPDAAVIVSCGARGVQLYGEEGLESSVLREVWGRDVPTVGIFAGGEIGPVGLKTYMHGYTTSCLMLRLGD